MLTYRLQRRGYFVTRFTTTPNQCGAEGNQLYRFQCSILSGSRLDSRGFVIDNLEVQAYFDRTYSVSQPALSCEQIAQRACKALAAAILKASVELFSISVTIIGGSNSNITCILDIDKPLDEPIAAGGEIWTA